ncbi:vitamin K epoxide reductase family protein [Nocardioides kribbensis]|uniref:vitamin K epoxide reductase family protein n=1 Tax=Nocardioides kribbensis TaxID=305517 RepID=UPI0032D9BC3F
MPPRAETDAAPLLRLRAPEPCVRVLPWLLLVCGLVGTVAAFVLVVERIALLTDSDYVPTCSLDPVLSCGSVMRTEQAEVFGFPNPLLGLAAFPLLAATGAALLAGARLRRWYWIALQTGVTAGTAFVAWLVFQSLYRIDALCPYCMVVWAVTLAAFCYVTLTNARQGTFGATAEHSRAVAVVAENHAVILTSAYLVVLGLVAHRFWDHWTSLVL